MLLKYPFGSIPGIETKVSLQYNEYWQREVIITWQQQDGLGLSKENLEKTPIGEELKGAKAIVEGMHGIFQYTPQAGKGFVVTIRYPELDLYNIGKKAAFSGPMRILVIDPDPKFIDQVYDTYTPRGCIVQAARDGHGALEIYRKQEIHLSIVDEHLSGSSFNGIDTIRKILDIDPEACCIMTTRSEEDEHSQAQARNLGVIAYYVKPFNIERINYSITETKGFFKLREDVKKWSTL